MHPDDYNMIYDYEWPKTAEDFAKLFAMKSFDLQEIYTDLNLISEKRSSQGIKFTFHGEKNPIKFGKLDETDYIKAVFNSSE